VLRAGASGRTGPRRGHPAAGSRPAPARILLLGGTSEIGLAILGALRLPDTCEVILAGRDEQRLKAAAVGLAGQVQTMHFDAAEVTGSKRLAAAAFAAGPVDLVIAAAGILVGQDELDTDPDRAGLLVQTNFTGHVTALLAIAERMRAQGSGTIVVLSSIAATRPRKANFVYGAAKAGLDAFGRGLADALHGSGVRVLLVRPGFVLGRMTAGMSPAPLSTTPAQVGRAVAAALGADADIVWVPRALQFLSIVLRLVPRPLWRRIRR
jgi:decaprenylphospho-beta-D-erythro-pentofuranosid-2-ulose 2-reductase